MLLDLFSKLLRILLNNLFLKFLLLDNIINIFGVSIYEQNSFGLMIDLQLVLVLFKLDDLSCECGGDQSNIRAHETILGPQVLPIMIGG